MIKRHPVYPYNICCNGVIMESGFADALSSPTNYAGRSITVLPASKKKKQAAGIQAPQCFTGFRACTPISSLTDYAGRSIAAASTTDIDGLSSCAMASMASRHVLWGRPSCPQQSETRQGADKTGSTILHWLQGLHSNQLTGGHLESYTPVQDRAKSYVPVRTGA